MRRANFLAALVLALASTAAGAQVARTDGNGDLQRLLREGYEIKAAFVDSGTPYVILQKQASAFMCKGGRQGSCEKIN